MQAARRTGAPPSGLLSPAGLGAIDGGAPASAAATSREPRTFLFPAADAGRADAGAPPRLSERLDMASGVSRAGLPWRLRCPAAARWLAASGLSEN